MPAEVVNDARFKRGNEFWRLGKLSEGKAEFQALRDAYSDNPAVLYPLAVYYRDIGLYYPSIVAAASLIRQSPAGSIENAPLFLQRLVYPIYYANLIVPEAQAHNIDPMIIFSLMRAESLFDGAVTSSAAAGGLMQIIPPTGEQIARDLSWSNYQQSDLYRPIHQREVWRVLPAALRPRFSGWRYVRGVGGLQRRAGQCAEMERELERRYGFVRGEYLAGRDEVVYRSVAGEFGVVSAVVREVMRAV